MFAIDTLILCSIAAFVAGVCAGGGLVARAWRVSRQAVEVKLPGGHSEWFGLDPDQPRLWVDSDADVRVTNRPKGF